MNSAIKNIYLKHSLISGLNRQTLQAQPTRKWPILRADGVLIPHMDIPHVNLNIIDNRREEALEEILWPFENLTLSL